jgi:hypothetical protein
MRCATNDKRHSVYIVILNSAVDCVALASHSHSDVPVSDFDPTQAILVSGLSWFSFVFPGK